MKAALALAVLTASTIGLAQQTTPPSPAEPRTSASPQEQTAPPVKSSARMSETDKQILLKDCTRQVEASHPTVPEKDVKAYCEQEVRTYSIPQ